MPKLAPRAHSFQLAECEDPNCGPHIIALDEEGNEMAEIVITPSVALGLIEALQAMLYKKATCRD